MDELSLKDVVIEDSEYKLDTTVISINGEPCCSVEERLEVLEAFMEKALANPMIAGMLE